MRGRSGIDESVHVRVTAARAMRGPRGCREQWQISGVNVDKRRGAAYRVTAANELRVAPRESGPWDPPLLQGHAARGDT